MRGAVVKATSLQRRVAKLQRRMATLGTNEPEIHEFWFDEGDGILRNHDGRSMTLEELEAAFPNVARTIVEFV
jgi:hypothetical protein